MRSGLSPLCARSARPALARDADNSQFVSPFGPVNGFDSVWPLIEMRLGRRSTILPISASRRLAYGIASALPTVTFKAEAVAIKGFPHTGNILGAGAAVQAEYKISGTEYDNSPPPLIGINFYLPSGTKLHTTGFPTCSKTTLEQFGPVKCSKGSAAGPVGTAEGFVTFGGERVV